MVYKGVRTVGMQQYVLDLMQTRADLYEHLGYHAFEQKLDALYKK